MSDQQVLNAWTKIDRWLQRHAPSVLSSLAAGATAPQLAEVERRIGVPLPKSLSNSLQIHDGQTVDMYGGTLGLIDAAQLNSCQGIIECWESWNDSHSQREFEDMEIDAEPGIASVPWVAKWIPVTYSASGSCYFVDLSPSSGGTVGQIIHGSMVEIQRWVAAPSFGAWLSSLADAFESGQYELSEQIGGLVRVRSM